MHSCAKMHSHPGEFSSKLPTAGMYSLKMELIQKSGAKFPDGETVGSCHLFVFWCEKKKILLLAGYVVQQIGNYIIHHIVRVIAN